MNDMPEAEVRTSASRLHYLARLRRVFITTGMLALLVGIACVFGFKYYGLTLSGGVGFEGIGDSFLNGAIFAMCLGLVSIICIQVCHRRG